MKKLLLIALFVSLCYSQEDDYQSKIDSLNLMLKETEKTVSLLKEKLKSEQNEISKIKREISGFKSSLFAQTVGGFEDGFKLKPSKSGYIMYGDKEPDRFDFAKFSTMDELTIFREMIELGNIRWYKAMHKGKLGWINRPNIIYDESKIPFFHDLGVDSSEVKFSKPSFDDNFADDMRTRRIDRSNSRFKSQIKRRQVVIGMTLDEVQMAIGYPKDTNKTTYSFGTRTQLVYGGKFVYDFIYLDDGIVTAIQE